ncbi:NlpC/P60 family protein [Bacillus cereus]|uniref:NlpC/P60 family protein n=1 Tax=Bacillus cereus TaxID=1396 RepID=UPI0018A6DF7F|nr:NlpC/P60 family protein [Bacillus cereus]MBF8118237.1 C40 family peptidase [Bacillus cereus]
MSHYNDENAASEQLDELEHINTSVEIEEEENLRRRLLNKQPSSKKSKNNVVPFRDGDNEEDKDGTSERLERRKQRDQNRNKTQKKEQSRQTANDSSTGKIESNSNGGIRDKAKDRAKEQVKKVIKEQTQKLAKNAAKKAARKAAVQAAKKALAAAMKKLVMVLVKIIGAVGWPILLILLLVVLCVVIFSMISSMLFSSAPEDKLDGMSAQDKDTRAYIKQLSQQSFSGPEQWAYRLPEELLSAVVQLDSWRNGKDLKDFDPNRIDLGGGLGGIGTGGGGPLPGGGGGTAADTGNYPITNAGPWMTFEATGYYGEDSAMQGGFCPAVGCDKIGFNFSQAIRYNGYRIVAVDPRVVPLWSIVEINDPGTGLHIQGVALDTGGAIKGNRIDILHENRTQAYAFGRRKNTQVRVLRVGKGDNTYPQRGEGPVATPQPTTTIPTTVPTPTTQPTTTPTTTPTPNQPTEAETKKADQVIEEAKKYLGVPYVWGGTSPKGFDCSGLTQYVYRAIGIPLDRTAAMQSKQGKKITNVNDMRKGDLIFFANTGNRTGITHVAIYIGNGKMIEAPDVGQTVKISDFKTGKFAWATRVLGDGDLSSNEGTDVSTGGGGGISTGPVTIDKALLKYFYDKLKPDFTYEDKTETVETKTKTCAKKKEGSEDCAEWTNSINTTTRTTKVITKVRAWNGNAKVHYKEVKSGWKRTGDNTEVQETNYLQDKQEFKYDYSKLDEILSQAGYKYGDKKMFELFYEYASGLPLHYIDWVDGKDISQLLDGDFIGDIIPGSSIPPQFMPIYLGAEKKFGTPWYILAAVHYHKSSFSKNITVSAAGERGPMQIKPVTWMGWKHPSRNSAGELEGISDKDLMDLELIKKYGGKGVDGNGDKKADINDNHDSIYSASKILADFNVKSDAEKALWLYTNSKDGGKQIYDTAMKFKNEATYKHDQNQLPEATSGDWMTPTQGRLTSGYGERSFDNHHGIDIAQKGTVPIVAAADGVVFRSYLSQTYGNCVMIRHNINGQQYETVYAHMRNRAVTEGTTVKKGQFLGYQGETGQAYGQHLHFEMHKPSWNINKSYAINPIQYIKIQ